MTEPVKPKRKGKQPNPTGMRYATTGVMYNGLTPEQEAFCRARAMGMNTQEALITAGSKAALNTAKKWETQNKAVMDRINELSAMATKSAILKTGLDREWVISRLMTVTERCMQAEPVLDNKGMPTGEYTFDSSGANQALKMLGDTLGLFKPAEKKPGDEYAELSDDDIARIAAELAAQTGLIEVASGTETAPGPQQVIEVQALRAPG